MEGQAPSSFGKSLFFGHIPESMVIPYPRMANAERDRVRELIATLRDFARDTIDSRAIDEKGQIPAKVLSGLKARGFYGLWIPKAFGGSGLSASGYARVMQELGAIDASVAVTLSAHQSVGCRGLVLYGDAAQQKRYLPKLASGEMTAAFALSEPQAGSDAASVRTRAERTPEGDFILTGQKVWVTNGGLADFFTVFAQTRVDREGGQKDRITAFLVERKMGVRIGPEIQKLGTRGTSTTTIDLDEVRVPKENVLGQVGGGFKVAQGILNMGRVGISAAAIGQAQSTVRLALAHATTRRQFGRVISEFGLVKDKIGRMMVDLYAAESMLYLTTGLMDRGVDDFSVESAACKIFASETLWHIVQEALQIAPALGVQSDMPYERMLRDARVNLVFDGTNDILRCFIALSGMQGPGDRLSSLAQAIRFPLRGYGLAMDFMLDKLKTQYYGGERLDHIHPQLKREAVLFEDWVPELAKNVEKALRKHGSNISEMQFVQRRIADISIDLFAMIASMSRATASLLERGPDAEREAKLCRAVCTRASLRIKHNVRAMDDNDDEPLKAIAYDAYEAAEYPFDVLPD
ncbi:MAG: acyl-CoA dehydrogenase family protein [Polyangia bacterium]